MIEFRGLNREDCIMTSHETGSDLYTLDFHTWTATQAEALREGRLDRLDLANLIEEVESMGKSQESELRSRYKILCLHLLKWIYQPSKATRSWTTTILDQRLEIAQCLSDNPGLKPKRDALFAQGYSQGRRIAASETGLALETFPAQPPFTANEAGNERWMPAMPAIGRDGRD